MFFRKIDISEVAYEQAENRFLAVNDKGIVLLLDINKDIPVSKVKTNWSFGGDRLAWDPINNTCFTGNWDSRQVEAYDLYSKKKIWQYQKSDYVGHMRFSQKENALYVFPPTAPSKTVILNPLNGELIEEHSWELCNIVATSSGTGRFIEDFEYDCKKLLFNFSSTLDYTEIYQSKELDDVFASSKDFILITEPHKHFLNTKLISLESRKVIDQLSLYLMTFCTSIIYCKTTNSFNLIGSLRDDDASWYCETLQISSDNKLSEGKIFKIPQCTFCDFCCNGEMIITTSGDLISTNTGEVIRTFK